MPAKDSRLALLARVDVGELLQAIRATWPDSNKVRQWVDACPRHTTVSLGIVENGSDIEWYQAVVCDTDGSHWTFAPYVAIRAELERRLQRDIDPMSVRVPIRVMLVSRGGVHDQRGESQFLWDLLAIVMNDHLVSPTPSRSAFYIAEIGVHQRGAFEDHAVIIELLVEHGVRFHSLYIDDDEEITEETASAFMVHGPKILTAGASVDFFDTASTETLDGIFSLLLANESIHEVMIIGNMGIGTRRFWEWIFTAFFSTAVTTVFHRLVLYSPATRRSIRRGCAGPPRHT
jgi:hypothetical protein